MTRPIFLGLLLRGWQLEAQASKWAVVIAHRGEHLKHPENTIAAIQGAIEAGADYVELDVRTTADGEFVLMHDSDVSRMTNGHGEVAAMTLAEIKGLEVGRNSGTRVPTFDEALAFTRGKIGVYVDAKRIPAAGTIAAIDRHDMGEHVVIYGGKPYLAEIVAQRPKWKVMPEAENPAHAKSLLAAMPLQVMAFDARDFNDETIRVAREAGVAIHVDRLGPADSPKFWQDAIDRGATGIQTDHPAELVAYLKAKGYR